MTLRQLWKALLLVLFPPCASAQLSHVDFPNDLEPALMVNLGRMADTATIEHVYCLMATPDGRIDSLGKPGYTIDVAFVPDQTGAPGYAVFTSCPLGTVAQWHNHILASTLLALKKLNITPPTGIEGAWQACVLSMMDYDMALRSQAPVTMIQVDARTWCWWNRADVAKLPRALVNWPEKTAIKSALLP